ncbi:unnamed protein product [Moneuplotes crassus]|uniref:Uncharacterized protein n=1 Tax=Euplotes crassus TaxID=5936 RepID=A0AAD2D9X1_EUPCR|nr:unnamed protein product [Moneuplotes crassus]
MSVSRQGKSILTRLSAGNVTQHNPDLRPETQKKFGFLSSMNMGIESTSKPFIEQQTVFQWAGHRNELLYLFAFLALGYWMKSSKLRYEDSLRKGSVATNTYAKMDLSTASREFTKSIQ